MPTPDDETAPNTDLVQLVAAAADLCRRPLRHAVLPARVEEDTAAAPDMEADGAADGKPDEADDCCLRLEVRSPDGERRPQDDLELELYRSGDGLNLTLAWADDPDRPMLWHGQHPVWMRPDTGERCERPQDGAALEALARRLRALMAPAPA
ncbi:conserved hypothetical protein [Cyanobium sp. PCC 7001]|uniref:hypothetical protein n=1 Tax=Cyanobium sp. PCC 7001 TaxID=180281 RepID=UPI00018057D0|nr:hypothetical protein [Cyanobium sp. PCC 7001]EDY38965.1 conserved hypothetical protein [Cyanobium sp. PCC 7001]